MPGTKARVPLFDETDERIRGREFIQHCQRRGRKRDRWRVKDLLFQNGSMLHSGRHRKTRWNRRLCEPCGERDVRSDLPATLPPLEQLVIGEVLGLIFALAGLPVVSVSLIILADGHRQFGHAYPRHSRPWASGAGCR